jgi:16S rRNA (cytosine1402-N4)-methyltransferase
MSQPNATYHVPVLLPAVIAAASGARRVVDATLGDGGHAEALLATGASVLGIDRDPSALRRAATRLGHDRIDYLASAYAAPETLAAVARFAPDFILLDLGVSSPQLDEESRGFTFRPGAVLDMRMSSSGPDAAALLNGTDEAALTTIFEEYGDERRGRRLAKEVIRRRGNAPFVTSDDLVNAIRGALGPKTGPGDFARLFQAIRIAVNDELTGLGVALPAFRDALVSGGRLAVISYHSGEDRLVKHLFRSWEGVCVCPPRQPICTCSPHAYGVARPRRPIIADEAETARNPRARSARLRIFQVNDRA